MLLILVVTTAVNLLLLDVSPTHVNHLLLRNSRYRLMKLVLRFLPILTKLGLKPAQTIEFIATLERHLLLPLSLDLQAKKNQL